MNEYKFIVVGAGFSGAVLAERIANILNEKVLVYEKREHTGGNAYDYLNENRIYIHKYGPHIFHTDSQTVINYLSQFTEWYGYRHKVFAKVDNSYIPLPFDFRGIEILLKKKEKRIKKVLLNRYGKNKKVPIYELLNTKNPDLKEFGEFVFEKIFLHYSKKQWGVNPLTLSKRVLKRVPVYIGYADSYFDNKFQGIPSGGFSSLFEKMLNHKNIKLMLGKDFREDFELRERKFFYRGKYFDGIIIFTGEIDYLFDFKFGRLSYRSLRFDFEDISTEEFQPVAVVNYPGKEDFTRITEYKHFLNQKVKKTTISREYPGEYKRDGSDFNIPYYPFFDKKNEEIYLKYKKEASLIKNLFTVGRLAEYKYYNMDDAVLRALEVFEEIKRITQK